MGQLSDMDLRLLKVFKTVVDCGGMTAAERELNIGGSTVSRHIKDLETRLGLVLCRRGRSGFALTAEGQRVYDEVLRLLASVDSFRNSIDDIHLRMGGSLEVAMFDKLVTNPDARVATAIARFSDLAPDVALSIHVASTNPTERGILDGTFHVGIVPSYRSSKSLSYTELFGETMLLFCGENHPLYGADHRPLTWQNLQSYAFAGLGFVSPNMEISHRARLSRRATAFDQEAIALLILSGRYLGFLPNHYAAEFVTRGTMQPIAPNRFKYAVKYSSVLRLSPQPSRAALLFQECLVSAHASKPLSP
ncbi:LysR family transcriptional regulator [Cupriavidus sp. CuC1]|uniref:LysR family transcriptional regulator n=1 Tax=Cupriavidus sp. CuC1 TaxID=3373131 RepID=UPI0037CE082F